MMMQKEKKRVPKLRFAGFEGEWEEKRLEEVAKLERGKFTPRPRNNPIYYNGNIPFVQTGDVVNSNGFISKYSQTLNERGLKVSKLFPKGTILITIAANIGYAGVLNEDMACPDSLIGIKCKQQVYNWFLNYIFQIEQPRMEYLAVSAAQKNINLEFLKPYKLRIPKLKEQQKIATFLTSIDTRIQLLEKKKTLLEQYKKGVMQKIFSQEIRFKRDDGEEFGKWEKKSVSEMFRVTRGNVLSMTKVSDFNEGEYMYPVYSSQTKNGGLSGFYNEYLYENALTWTTDGANAGDVNYRTGKFYCTNVCGVLLSDEGYANTFIAEKLNSITRKYVSYVGNPKLMNGVMSEIVIEVPSIPEQTKIAHFLTSLDKKIAVMEQQIAGAKEWKKGLLQRMFV